MRYLTSKLNGFPNCVYSISLTECEHRRGSLIEEFSHYGINKINFTISERFERVNEKFEGEFAHTICNDGKSIIINHIKSLLHWYTNYTDEYALFTEDDVELSTIPYWGFTWFDFIKNLPNDWECVQLHVLRTDETIPFEGVKLWQKNWYDHSAAAFIAKRSYVKKLLNSCYKEDGTFVLQTGYETPFFEGDVAYKFPYPEHVIYSYGKVYTFPLFLENIKFHTTSGRNKSLIPHKPGHVKSYNDVKEWWKTNQHTHNLIEMMKL